MELSKLKNQWIYYPWLINNDLDHLVHHNDLTDSRINGLGVVLCIGQEDNYIKIRANNFELRVKEEGILKLLPKPLFIWNDKIELLKNKNCGTINDIIWHHKDEKYYYFIESNGKQLKKRLNDTEIKKI
ncbi:hypothetical protein [Cellulophaga sp. L1A9]|uniref:hypothetical protein n=1 Tax=Cellulophaga sp. L1A9 TaxID=2686362 RepID=UPI00131E4E8F|nr:hypothetical protein [Cellulophaga sp. L1A9]